MKVLLVGSGGREHALASALVRSPSCSRAALRARQSRASPRSRRATPLPSSTTRGSSSSRSSCAAISSSSAPRCRSSPGWRTTCAPPASRSSGRARAAARLEGSKAFAKDVMRAAGVPTARHIVLTSLDEVEAAIDELGGACVVKADGLAAGKGVVVASGRDEAIEAARSFLSGEALRRGGRDRRRRGAARRRGGLAARAVRRPLGAAAPAGARLQAHRRRRQRPEHRRHGRDGAGSRADAASRPRASASSRTSRCCSSSSAAAPASPGASTPG